jgi:hypothetical protein
VDKDLFTPLVYYRDLGDINDAMFSLANAAMIAGKMQARADETKDGADFLVFLRAERETNHRYEALAKMIREKK